MKVKVFHDNCRVPFLVRLELIRAFGWSLKLHVFLRSDHDEELHDHPWSFWSIILAGGYDEITEKGTITRKAGSFSYRPARWRHRVMLKDNKPCATLILTSPVKREWGFWRRGKFIPWQQFDSRHQCD